MSEAGDQNYQNIATLHQEHDTRNYTIKVHALKSSSRIIGAAELSSLAKDLEAAGDKMDWEFIKTHHGQMMTSTVSSCKTVRMGEVISMVTSTTTSVTTLDAHWGMDWEIICRRVSMSLV